MNKISSFSDSVISTAKRFPISSVLIVCTLIYYILIKCGVFSTFHVYYSTSLEDVLCFYLPYAILLSVSCSVALEKYSFANVWKILINCMLVSIGALWSYYTFRYVYSIDSISDDASIRCWAVTVFGAMVLFCLPFLGKLNNNRAYVNYAKNSCWYGVLTLVVFAAVWLLLVLGFVACEKLSLISGNIQSNCTIYSLFICFTAGLFYFLTQLKSTQKIYDNNTLCMSNACKVIGYYICLPFAALYAIILYVYAIKSIVTLTMPYAPVVWMVSGLFALCIATAHLLYDDFERNRVARFFARWAWAIFLPLAVLMTVGLAYRINQYGITIWRSAGIVYNVWLYAILIFLFVTRCHHLKWVVISFGILTVLASFGPWSISEVTLNIKYNEMTTIMGESGFPAEGTYTRNELVDFVNSLPADKAKRFVDDHNYLHSNGRYNQITEACVDFDEKGHDGYLSYFWYSNKDQKYVLTACF